jgi:hypothetical protein
MVEDRGSRIEDRGLKIEDRIALLTAILDPRSSIFVFSSETESTMIEWARKIMTERSFISRSDIV